jgi:DNA-binding FadR family transcriptional regulator
MSAVLADIVGGQYAEGDALPKETDLAAAHGVSRYVARESILALSDRGVVSVRHGVGATVAPEDEWQLYDRALLEALLAGPLGKDALPELTECRQVLWTEVAAIAARRRTKKDLARLEAVVDDGEAFEATLLGAARNRFLRAALAACQRGLKAAASEAGSGDAARLEPILEAVQHGDAEAARLAMRARLGRRPDEATG